MLFIKISANLVIYCYAFQPALYEAFGLTVIEAMNCGLPTFATNQGGPVEIIVNEVSGFHINPLDGKEASNKIADFFQKCKEDPMYWDKMSTAGLQRIYEWYKCPHVSSNHPRNKIPVPH